MKKYDTIVDVGARRYDEIDEIAKFNQFHDSNGRFASANGRSGGGAARSYGTTDTSDALAEIQSGKTNSLKGYLDENGKLTPEREAVHKKIIDDLLQGKEPVDGQATMTMLGGGPASGKSSVMNANTSNDPHSVTVNPDDIKEMLPGYSEMSKKTDQAAAFYHEESSALAKRFYETALKENVNVVYDGTGDGSVGSVQKKIDAAKAAGYKVEAKYVTIDTDAAVARNKQRYLDAKAKGENPRLVPEDYVRKTHAKCTDISVAMAPKFDHIEVWDNNGEKGRQKLIATGGGGKGLVATDKAAFENFLAKGSNGAAGFTTLPDGQVVPVGN